MFRLGSRIHDDNTSTFLVSPVANTRKVRSLLVSTGWI